jgi:hypothetical protein
MFKSMALDIWGWRWVEMLLLVGKEASDGERVVINVSWSEDSLFATLLTKDPPVL